LNLIGDFGGGALYMAVGALAAYIEAQRSGQGQVVDCAMVEGAASLMTAAFGYLAQGIFHEQRQSNRLDGGCHHYGVYETKDGEHVAIGANEPQFYKLMLETVGLGEAELPAQTDREAWPRMRAMLAEIFKTKTREEWTEIMEQKDVCFAPVLRMSEAMQHHHNVARGTFVEVDGVPQPAPAPRFQRTPSAVRGGCGHAGADTQEALAQWGFGADEVEALLGSGAARQR
jgi:alpha-methylacyl-CoA racemase